MTAFDTLNNGTKRPDVPPMFSNLGSVNLRELSAAFSKAKEGRTLEGRAKQLAFSIERQLKSARKLISKGKFVPVLRTMLVDDIDEFGRLLSALPDNGGTE